MTTTLNPAAFPDLAGDYAISAEQSASYQKNGYILLRDVASAEEVAPYRDAITGAVRRTSTETRSMEERDTYAKAFLQISNIWVTDEAVRKFTMARRFGKIAADLMGVDGVRIYHDQALYKEAGGGHTPWHQDHHYWPLDTDNTITMWMPLVDITEDMGTLNFAAGSHETGYLGNIPISDESELLLSNFVRDKGYNTINTGPMKAGDATFHSGWTLHGAPGNHSNAAREVMTIIYFADGARASVPQNSNQQDDLDNWLAGREPGDLADTELNPLVYHK